MYTLEIYSGILSGIYYDILSGIYICIYADHSDILSAIYSGILSGRLFWHSILAFYLASMMTFFLVHLADVRQWPLRSGARG